jgi:predicted RNase H-like nuclease
MIDPDEKINIYNEAYKSFTRHTTPSTDTIKFMSKIEQQVSNICDKLKDMPTRDEMLLANEHLVEKIFEKANEKYASKITEKVVYGMVGVILLYILNQFLELI